MYYTYILISRSGARTYTGHTRSLERRLKEHNHGEVTGSKAYRPYDVLHVESFRTRSEAKLRELYYKNYRGRQKIKELIRKYKEDL